MILFAWLATAISSALGGLATFLVSKFAYERAQVLLIATVFASLAFIAYLTTALGIKNLILAARETMPPMLVTATYFLPPNVNQVMGVIVAAKVSRFLYRYAIKVAALYMPTDPKHGLLL